VDGVVEIITGRERRRRWSTEDKLRLVAETKESGHSPADLPPRQVSYFLALSHRNATASTAPSDARDPESDACPESLRQPRLPKT
jgi:hypothetical protein